MLKGVGGCSVVLLERCWLGVVEVGSNKAIWDRCSDRSEVVYGSRE